MGGGLMIIAMKGHPGTGKSTLAKAIATAIKSPLVDKDQIRDCTSPIEEALKDTTVAAKLLNDLSYDVVWRVISTQLDLGLTVVVDSPLSRRAHLDRLVDIADQRRARVLVVECRPGDAVEWRRRVEERAAPWHKPHTWEEMEKLIELYAECWNYEFGDTPRVILDTTAESDTGDLVRKVICFLNLHGFKSNNS